MREDRDGGRSFESAAIYKMAFTYIFTLVFKLHYISQNSCVVFVRHF